MKTYVKVTCNTGYSWKTSINTDLNGAKAHFLGTIYTQEDQETGEETQHEVVSVVSSAEST